MKYPIVMPTDTLYGLIAPVFDKPAMRRLHKLKGRPKGKPFIILINSIAQLKKFKIKLTAAQKTQIKKLWPGPISIVLNRKAFRLPQSPNLRKFLAKTGPLAAPSANPAGKLPARNITEAREYFGNQVSTYLTGRVRSNQPSTLIKLSKTGQIKILRQGVAIIKPNKVQ